MRYIYKCVFIAIFVGTLYGCNFEAPEISSASYVEFSGGSPGPKIELNSQQVHALSGWLFEHRSGWSRSMVTYSPRILIAIDQKDGKSSTLDLWPNTINYYGPSGQYQKTLTDAEALVLFKMIGAERK